MINRKKRYKDDDFKVEIDLIELSQEALKTIKDILVKSEQFEASHKVRRVERIIERLFK